MPSTRKMGVAEESHKPFSVHNLSLEVDYLMFILPYSSVAEHLILVQGTLVRVGVGQPANWCNEHRNLSENVCMKNDNMVLKSEMVV